MNIPWRLKSAAFAIIDVIGEKPLYTAQRLIGRGSTVPISPSWEFHLANLRKFNVARSIEFGAGKHLGMAIFLSRLGHRQVAVDLNRMIDLALVNKAVGTVGVKLKRAVENLDDLRDFCRIEYFAPVDMQKTSFESNSFDACVSTNVLEHVPVDVIRGIWEETWRLLKPGGIVSAKIDYSDHYAHTDRSISKLNYLSFSDREWSRYNHNCHFQNRLRHKHHLELLESRGFEILEERTAFRVDISNLKVRRENLSGDLSDYDTEGFVLARKPLLSNRL
jgi:cyclopropane fatty-acyl-phospholipid synthase-like methyltransferase